MLLNWAILQEDDLDKAVFKSEGQKLYKINIIKKKIYCSFQSLDILYAFLFQPALIRIRTSVHFLATYCLWKPMDMKLDMCDANVQKHQFSNLPAY